MILRKLRLDRGLSQEQLSAMSGVSVRTIQRIERGASATPESLKCLAAVLDVDFTDLRKDQQMTATNLGTPATNLSEAEREALEHVRDIKGFYTHALGFVAAMVLLAALNLWLTPGVLWVVFVAVGWGIGLLSHGLSVYEVFDPFGPDWERRQVAKRLQR